MSMDACCERIASLLCQGGQSSPRSLAKLLEKTGLARSSVMMHLKHLEGQALVVKEEILGGSVGRPKMLYKPSPKLLEQMLQTKSD
jgi:predicted ArsR family transcriptional regulator